MDDEELIRLIRDDIASSLDEWRRIRGPAWAPMSCARAVYLKAKIVTMQRLLRILCADAPPSLDETHDEALIRMALGHGGRITTAQAVAIFRAEGRCAGKPQSVVQQISRAARRSRYLQRGGPDRGLYIVRWKQPPASPGREG